MLKHQIIQFPCPSLSGEQKGGVYI